MTDKSERDKLDARALGWGFVIGLFLGGIGALFKAPNDLPFSRSQRDKTRKKLERGLESITQSDTVAETIDSGNASADNLRADMD